MHKGVFHGKNADQQKRRILILCESHHTNKEHDVTAGIPASYTTASVVENDYIKDAGNKKDYRHYRIFGRIEQSFDVFTQSEEQRRNFWDNVYFGNYIPVLCGVGDSKAKNTIKAENHREEYNDQLFSFVNDNQIDAIFCFSRLVYNNLPKLAKEDGDKQDSQNCEPIGRKKDYINICKYVPGAARPGTSIPLIKELTVYGMRHPSAKGGFKAENYKTILGEKLRECLWQGEMNA